MPGLNPFDSAIMTFVQSTCHNLITDTLFPFITYLGELGCFWIVVALVLLFREKTRACGILMLLTMLCTCLLGEVLIKNIICRPRPCHDYPGAVEMLVPIPDAYSFPSGHSSSSFGAALILFSYSKKWGIWAFVLANLIAFSRIFLFVHYPSDVLAGILLGLLFGTLNLWVYRRVVVPKLEKRQQEKEPKIG